VINDMLTRIIDIKERIEKSENEMAKIGKDREDVKKLMTIPGINIYISTGIIGEIGDIQRFRNKESLASYAGLVPIVCTILDLDNIGREYIYNDGYKWLRSLYEILNIEVKCKWLVI